MILLMDYMNKLGVEYVTSKNGNISKIITVKEVIEGNYKDLKNQIINKYATLIELANVDEENLLEVRNFVIEMGPEFVSLFDNLWIHDDPKRKQKIKELTLNKNNENK